MSSFPKVFLIVLLFASRILAQFSVLTPAAGASVTAGSSVDVTWDISDNPDNLTMAVLFKQGDPAGINFVIQVLADSGTPNTGTYTWNVNASVPSGDNYYIRLQTGTASDFGGGLGGPPPTPDGVYGLSDLFTIVSTVASTSYANPTTSAEGQSMAGTGTSTSSISTTGTASSSSSKASSSSKTSSSTASTSTTTSSSSSSARSHRNVGGLLVGSVAGLVALALFTVV